MLCKASEHIAEQIEMIRTLEEKGVTYRIADGLYFDVAKFPRYAELARLDLAQQLGGDRIGEVEGKRHPADFALWKFAKPGVKRQQEWDSPWGRGFPGWHIECSAMGTKYLGRRFDIHTGGVDHLPVHHTNEVAQSEVALDVHPWVNVWMHEDWLVFGGEKMAKSLGNVALLQDLVDQGLLPLSLRYFLLQAHYRKQQGYSNEAMRGADRGYRRLLASAIEVRSASGARRRDARGALARALPGAVRDDLNAPRALAVAIEMLRDDALAPADKRALLGEFDAFLGLDLLNAELPAEASESDPRIDALVAEREAARKRRDFASRRPHPRRARGRRNRHRGRSAGAALEARLTAQRPVRGTGARASRILATAESSSRLVRVSESHACGAHLLDRCDHVVGAETAGEDHGRRSRAADDAAAPGPVVHEAGGADRAGLRVRGVEQQRVRAGREAACQRERASRRARGIVTINCTGASVVCADGPRLRA